MHSIGLLCPDREIIFISGETFLQRANDSHIFKIENSTISTSETAINLFFGLAKYLSRNSLTQDIFYNVPQLFMRLTC